MGLHLFFVLTDPDPASQHVVTVVLVTARGHTDRTVALDVGDHPFVRHESNVDYGAATFVPSSKLNAAIAKKQATLQPDMSAELLARVRQGLLESSHTPNDVADYCRQLFDFDD